MALYGKSSCMKKFLNDVTFTGFATHAPEFSDIPENKFYK